MPDRAGGISGLGIAVIFAGGILAWSGIKGLRVTDLTRKIIAGQDPKTLTTPNPDLAVSPTGLISSMFGGLIPGFGGGGSPGSSTSPSVSSGPGTKAFAVAVLKAIGAPASAANMQSIEAWVQREGGGGANNPLNTTLGPPSATNFNSVGVKNFANMSEGATWTVRTILGGGYGDIIAALRSGNGLHGNYAGLSRWSGGGYSSVG